MWIQFASNLQVLKKDLTIQEWVFILALMWNESDKLNFCFAKFMMNQKNFQKRELCLKILA